MIIKTWNIENVTGYKPLTTLFEDFSIADVFGVNAIKETYKSGLRFAKLDYKYLTELVMVLNHKIWQHYGSDDELARLYNDLWLKADEYAKRNLKNEELEYFFRIID